MNLSEQLRLAADILENRLAPSAPVPPIRKRYKRCPYCIEGIDNCTHELEEEEIAVPAPAENKGELVDPDLLKVGEWYQCRNKGSSEWGAPTQVGEYDEDDGPWATYYCEFRRCDPPATLDEKDAAEIANQTPEVYAPSEIETMKCAKCGTQTELDAYKEPFCPRYACNYPSKWHNPDNVTAEQLGPDHRFLLPEEVDGRFEGVAEIWSTACSHWVPNYKALARNKNHTYRVPKSTPLPQGDTGKCISCGAKLERDDDGKPFCPYIPCKNPLQTPPPKQRVALEAGDVKPGDIFTFTNGASWLAPTRVGEDGLTFVEGTAEFPRVFSYKWEQLLNTDRNAKISRDNGATWQPCSKEA